MPVCDDAGGLHCRRDLLQLLEATYGGRTLGVLKAMRVPPRQYAIRVNTLRAEPEDAMEYFSEIGVRCVEHDRLEEALLIQVEGPFDVERTGRMFLADKQAAESVMMGSKLYSPGVLRMERVGRGDPAYVADLYGHVVGSGTSATTSRQGRGAGVAVDTSRTVYRLPPIRECGLFSRGMIQQQSIPAIATSRALDPQRGETIVDMCAAPGGKTLHIAQLQGDSGRVLAFEQSPRRIERLRSEVQRLGMKSVRVEQRDSRYLDTDLPGLKADRVLVDPPCTALGVRPKLYEEATAEGVLSCAEYQKQFLKVAARIVRPGGTVVYSTCTLSKEENEGVVGYAMEELNLEPAEPGIRIGGRGIGPGFSKVQRFDPDMMETPGYFIAKFTRCS